MSLLLAGCTPVPQSQTASSGSPDHVTSVSTEAGEGSCTALAESLTLERQVGQLFMVGISSTDSSVPQQVVDLVAAGKVGSVILVGNTTAGIDAVSALTSRLASIDQSLPVIIAADQEGGSVQRLRGAGFDRIPSAAQQAKLSDSDLRGEAAVWGGQLQRAGVAFNLAPVADVVPAALGAGNPPIGRRDRSFGSDIGVVSAKVTAVVQGYHNARVATSLKHFPNLGAVTKDTDTSAEVADTATTANSPELAPFRAGIAAGTESVMVSNAIYTRIDDHIPGVFSSRVISILRVDLGFDGVIISDDLGSTQAVSGTPVAERGVRFLAAGGDLALNVDAITIEPMIARTLAKAKTDPAFATVIAQKAARVLKLKSATGLVDCR